MKEKTKGTKDHIDFLMAELRGGTRCEIEIMRDELDGSHLGRLLECCGVKRQRHRCGTLHVSSIPVPHGRRSECGIAPVIYGKGEIRG